MTNPKIEEIKNNQFARACAEDGRLPKWHYEIDYLLGEVERLNEIISYLPKVPTEPYEREMARKINTLRAALKDAKDALEYYKGNHDGKCGSFYHEGRFLVMDKCGGVSDGSPHVAAEAIKKIEGVLK